MTQETENQTSSFSGISGSVVVCTGAAGGIGRALCSAFARHGASLVLVDHEARALEQAASDLSSQFPHTNIRSFVASVTEPSEIDSMCDEVQRTFGRIDILLNNAGISMNKPAIDLTQQEWKRAMDVNLSGVWYCSRSVARHMIRQGPGGRIVNVSSIWGVASSSGRLAYCVAKAGVIQMTRCLAVEWAPHGVRVNAICPGYTLTPFLSELIDSGRLDAEALERRTPLRRLGKPEDAAEAALYLCSTSASFVTGHALVSDGGWTADGF